MFHLKIKYKLFSVLISIYLVLILQSACKESTATASYKLKKAVRALSIFKNNSKFLEEIKNNPGKIRRLFNFIISIFYDPGKNKKYEEAINKRTTISIDEKKIYLMEIFDKYPNITDFQKMKIGYYIGSQRPLYFKNYKNTAIKSSIEHYIKNSKSEEISKNNKKDIWYPKLLNELLLLNEAKTVNLLSNLDKIHLNLFLQYHQAFNYFFEKNELHLFNLLTPTRTSNSANYSKTTDNKIFSSLRFLEEKVISSSKNSQTDEVIQEEDCMVETQLIIDSLKRNLESVKINSQEIYDKYNNYIKGVKESKIIKSFQEGIKNLENKKIEEKEKINNKAEILNLIVKISKGKKTISDYVDLVERAERELNIKIFENPVELVRNINGLLTHIQEFDKSKSTIHSIAELFLVVGNTVTLSSIPLYKKVGKYLKVTGDEINSIQKIIDSRVESSLKSLYLDEFDSEGNMCNISSRLPFVSQFFSDFSTDDFVYDQISTSVEIRKIFNRKIFSDNYEKIKSEFEDIGKSIESDIEKAHEEGYIDKYSSIGSDWDIGDSQFFPSNTNLHKDIDNILEKSVLDEQRTEDENSDRDESIFSSDVDYSDAESVIEKFGEW